MEINKVYNEDCLEGMTKIKDKSIDMILCDVPYGRETKCTNESWDKCIDTASLFKIYDRIIKDNGVICLTSRQPFTADLINAYRKNFRYELIWNKVIFSNFMLCNVKPLQNHENILIFYKSKPIYNPQKYTGIPYNSSPVKLSYYNTDLITEERKGETSRYPKSIITIPHVRKQSNIHPTQKPVALFEYLIRTYTNVGDLVLDNCMGSGTTAIACMNTKRNYIGFELDKGYFDKLNERINSHVVQYVVDDL